MSFKKSIVILAGGLGSRYQGLKQIDGITDNNSSILEYSIYDAIAAGFSKVVIIINNYVPKDYIKKLEDISFKNKIDFFVVYQDISDFVPQSFDRSSREKPWGTAHALLCAKNVVSENFVVINADDFYGKETYKLAADIINKGLITPAQYAIIAYPLYKTLSENGAVSRGICKISADKTLKTITERTHIIKTDSDIVFIEDQHQEIIDPETLVSMNFSIFNPSIFESLELYFSEFLGSKPLPKQEFFIPNVIQKMTNEHLAKTIVYTAFSPWMGITYPGDKMSLKNFLDQEIINKRYPETLWS